MIYLTYEEYSIMGGILDLTAFNRNLDRACGIIDGATRNRINAMDEIPTQVKALCRDLIEYLATNESVSEKKVASWSESSGVISESVAYTAKGAEDAYADIQTLLYDYLGGIIDKNGISLLYRGASY